MASYLVTGQALTLMYLPGGQVKIFRFFYPCTCILSLYLIFHETVPIDLTILEKNISYNFYTI